jgi:ribosomal protein S18 acetylase RimI-like enzyme
MAKDRVLVRRLKKGDATEISKIYAAITKKPCDLDFKRIVGEEIRSETDASFVAEVGGKVVGYMISYMTFGNFGVDKCAWIANFGVYPRLMGQGIGKRLAEGIFNYYRQQGVTNVFTSVMWDSTDLLSFFKTLGFDRSNFINLQKTLG